MEFEAALTNYRKLVNAEIDCFFDEKIEALRNESELIVKNFEEMREYVLRGGKRLRPAALIMAYKGVSENFDEKAIMHVLLCPILLGALWRIFEDPQRFLLSPRYDFHPNLHIQK